MEKLQIQLITLVLSVTLNNVTKMYSANLASLHYLLIVKMKMNNFDSLITFTLKGKTRFSPPVTVLMKPGTNSLLYYLIASLTK